MPHIEPSFRMFVPQIISCASVMIRFAVNLADYEIRKIVAQSGYIYILLNPSMPGLVKVGRTSRSVEERMRELNGTAVPTPFVLVYETLVCDCALAEQFVHTFLASRGHRISEDREFFNAPLKFVIDAVIAARERFSVGDTSPDSEQRMAQERSGPEASINEPWVSVLSQADDYMYGLNGEVTDQRAARSLYIQAARLGAPEAFVQLASMSRNGWGCLKNRDDAIDWLRKGCQIGNQWCWTEMAEIYMNDDPIEEENGRKCLRRFFQFTDLSSADQAQEREFYFRLEEYCRLIMNKPIPSTHDDELAAVERGAAALLNRIETHSDPGERAVRKAQVERILALTNRFK